jgi:hypothetical protein
VNTSDFFDGVSPSISATALRSSPFISGEYTRWHHRQLPCHPSLAS